MKVNVTDLAGEVARYKNVDEIAFANSQTFGYPQPLWWDIGKKKVIINSEGYSSMELFDDD